MKVWKFRGKGSVIGLQSPGYQLIMARADEYARLLAELHLNASERERAEAILADVRRALESRIWKVIPYPKYDLAWALLRQLRHVFCHKVPNERLVAAAVEDMAGDIGYVPKDERGAVRAELNKLRGRCLELLRPDPRAHGDPDREEQGVRAELEALSKRIAMAREAYWLKVNMTRNRIFIMGVALFGLLVLAVEFLPLVVVAGEDDPPDPFYWAVVFFGAIGGLISALIGAEPLDTRAAVFYIRRRLLYLRPVIGGTLGLIVYLALRSGAIDFPALNPETSPVFALMLAFAAGFSERMFIRRILAVAGSSEDGEPAAEGARRDRPGGQQDKHAEP